MTNVPAQAAALAPKGADQEDQEAVLEPIPGMLNCIGRLRDATRALRTTMENVTTRASATLKLPTHVNEWQDLTFIVDTTVKGLERGWRDQEKATADPAETMMHAVSSAISWDTQHAILGAKEALAARLPALMDTKEPWPIEILFEAPYRNLCATYEITKTSKGVIPESNYRQRVALPGRADHVYDGFALHLNFKKPGLYYQNQLPFGKILDMIRGLTADKVIPPRIGTVYQATIVYCFYEIIHATQEYHIYLDKYTENVANEAGKKVITAGIAPFAFLDDRVVPGREDIWFNVLERARDEALYVCKDYYATVEKSRTTDLLGGVDAGDLARNPGQIGDMVGNLLGIPGLNMDSLKGIPGLSGIMDAARAALSPAALSPAA